MDEDRRLILLENAALRRVLSHLTLGMRDFVAQTGDAASRRAVEGWLNAIDRYYETALAAGLPDLPAPRATVRETTG